MEKLGIELPLLLTQIFNFLLMVFILTKLLYKPILKILEERKKKIEEGLQFFQKAKEEEEKLDLQKKKIIQEAKDEGTAIIEEAKKDAKKLKEDILSGGKEELVHLKKRLEKEMKSKEEEMGKELMADTVVVASEMVKRLIPEVLKDEDQRKLISMQLTKIEKTHEKK